MSWIITGKEAGSLGLLDQYGGAVAAYSLRNLSLYYTDPVVRVRRDNDDAEDDFTATEVSDGTLAAWVGAGNNGFVRTWYDQSGNGHNTAQVTLSNQPLVVSSGSLVLENTKPSIDFNGTSHRLTNATLSVSQPDTVFGVCKRDNLTSGADTLLDGLTVQHVLYNSGTTESPNQRWVIASGVALGAVYNPATLTLFSAIYNSTSSFLFGNGSQLVTGNAGVNNLTGLSIGELRGTPNPIAGNYTFDGKISELIIYPSNQSANRTAIEANINAYYSIYP